MFATIASCTILGLAAIFILQALVKHLRIAYYMLKVPGPPGTWTNMAGLRESPDKVVKNLRRYALEFPVYKFYAGTMGIVNFVNPEDFELIMTNMKHNTKGSIYSLLRLWLGNGLLTGGGESWQVRRKILTPSFHFNILQDFIKIFHEETQRLVEVLSEECHKPQVEITNLVSGFTLNSIGKTAMGSDFDTRSGDGVEYKSAVYEMGRLLVEKMGQPWLCSAFMTKFHPYFNEDKRVIKILHKFTNSVIKEREDNFQPKPQKEEDSSYSRRKRLAMLDLLLTVKREQGIIDDDGIREEVDTFMFEGHDTTSLAIGYALMLLACNREVQDKVVEEVEEVLSGHKQPDYQLLNEMKYLDQVVKEVLRLYPSVHFISRYLGEDIVTSTGYKLKEGTQVAMYIYDLHHSPKYFPDPEKFDPDRFLPENCEERHNFAYVPFSAGSRNCIGQKFAMLEIKTVLCGILSKFILEPIDTPDTVVLVADIVLRAKDSIKVKFVPRHK